MGRLPLSCVPSDVAARPGLAARAQALLDRILHGVTGGDVGVQLGGASSGDPLPPPVVFHMSSALQARGQLHMNVQIWSVGTSCCRRDGIPLM
jgi:hypothetical protein